MNTHLLISFVTLAQIVIGNTTYYDSLIIEMAFSKFLQSQFLDTTSRVRYSRGIAPDAREGKLLQKAY